MDSNTYYGEVDIYDTITDTWSKGTPMPSARGYSSVERVGDRVYCIGGHRKGAVLKNVDIYDLISNTWSTGAAKPQGAYGMGSAVIGDRIYCFGGSSGYPKVLSNLEIYDTILDRWTVGAPMQLQKFHVDGLVYGNEIYVIGGSSQWTTYDHTIEIYNPDSNTWRYWQTKPNALNGYTAANKLCPVTTFAYGAQLYKNRFYLFNVATIEIYTPGSLVVEQFQTVDGVTLDPDNEVFLEYDGQSSNTYTGHAPQIPGYTCIGHRIDGGTLQSGAVAVIAGLEEDDDHYVTFVYQQGESGGNSGSHCCCTRVKIEVDTCINNQALLNKLHEAIQDERCKCGECCQVIKN